MKSKLNIILKLSLLAFIFTGCTQTANISDFKIKLKSPVSTNTWTESKQSPAQKDSFHFKSDKTGEHLLIHTEKISTDEEAKERIQRTFLQIKQLHEPQQAPYTGHLTKSTQCTSRNQLSFQIKDSDTAINSYMGLYASDGFLFGLCEEDKEAWKTQYLILFCKKQNILYQIKYFYSVKNEWLNEPIAECE